MANSYFQFKQFRVEQDRSAMKVCTDSCILGAYAEVKTAQTILDIGAGTGLLSLMMAQRSQATIFAVEINEAAARQAQENITASPWASRIRLHPTSLQEFSQHNQQFFDLIVSNPPFYADSQKSPDQAVNTARHTGELTFPEIIAFAQKFLAPVTGKLLILLPPAETQTFKKMALNAGFLAGNALQIFTQTNGKCIRLIQEYTLQLPVQPQTETLFIRNPDQTYTRQFQELLKAYYLIF